MSLSSTCGALSLETDQLSSDLGQALAARLDAIRAAGRILRATADRDRPSGLSDVFDELISAYPQLDWIAIADSHGIVVSANGALPAARRCGLEPMVHCRTARALARRHCGIRSDTHTGRIEYRASSATWPPRCATTQARWSASSPRT